MPPLEASNEAPAAPSRRRVWAKRLGVAAASLMIAVLVIPLLWPVTPLRGTVPPEQLADADSRFVTVDGVTLHYKVAGSDLAPVTVILLHGFGASTFSWRDQLPLIGDRARVVAFDRPAFGLTERPLPGSWSGASPYGPQANVDQLIGLMDRLDIDRAVLVAHSAGAVVAVNAAVQHPDRVQALVLEAPAVYEARPTPVLAGPVLRSPQMRRIGPPLLRRVIGSGADEFVASAYFDSAVVTQEVLAGYRLPFKADDWDRGLWELVAAPRESSAADLLGKVGVPTIVVAGRNDTFVPFENSARVADAIPDARLIPFDKTGHIPHEEQPEYFANEVYRFLDMLDASCGT